MSERELHELLEALHRELDETERVEPRERKLLNELLRDIRETLAREDDEEHGLGDRVGEAVNDFAESHPTISFALRRVVDALARMGI